MNNQPMTSGETHKFCCGCDNIKSLNDFYKVYNGYYQTLCKPCHNGRRHTPKAKKHPFDKYSQDVKQILIEYFPKRKEDKLKIPMARLSEMSGVNKFTLQSWRRKYGGAENMVVRN